MCNNITYQTPNYSFNQGFLYDTVCIFTALIVGLMWTISFKYFNLNRPFNIMDN